MSVFVKISQTQLQIPPTVSSDCFMWIDAVCLSQWPHKFRSDFISESLEAILKSFVCQIQVYRDSFSDDLGSWKWLLLKEIVQPIYSQTYFK